MAKPVKELATNIHFMFKIGIFICGVMMISFLLHPYDSTDKSTVIVLGSSISHVGTIGVIIIAKIWFNVSKKMDFIFSIDCTIKMFLVFGLGIYYYSGFYGYGSDSYDMADNDRKFYIFCIFTLVMLTFHVIDFILRLLEFCKSLQLIQGSSDNRS